MKTFHASAFILVSGLSLGASANELPGTSADLGSVSPAGLSDRTIIIEPGTRSINVTNGETVTIVVAGQRFTWNVETLPNQGVFNLAQIAPKDLQVSAVQVYVDPNPMYFGG